MGRGNVCVWGDYEGLWFVDRDYLDCYIAKFENEDGEYDSRLHCEIEYNDIGCFDYDYTMSEIYYEEFIREFIEMMGNKFDSFYSTGRTGGTIMENNLFKIKVVDNQWSYAVMLIQKENDYDDCLRGLQKRHYKNYLEGMKDILLDMFPEIGCYTGAWTHGTVKKG